MARQGEPPRPAEGDQSRTLQDLLRSYREGRGLTQEELAALVEPPLSPETISNLERGRTRPYRHTLELVCRTLALSETQAREVWTAWRRLRRPNDPSMSDLPNGLTPAQGQSPSTEYASSLRRGQSELAPSTVALPASGTITFLFTDVEASTRAWLRDACDEHSHGAS